MRDTTENDALSAMAGTQSQTVANADGKSREDMERELAYLKTTQEGRIRKANEDAAKANEELAAARRRIAELESADRAKRAIADIPENVAGEIPDDFKTASAAIAASTVDASMSEMKSRIDAMEQQARERMERMERQAQDGARNTIVNRLNAEYPGFLNGIGPGGDKKPAWDKYLRHNSASVSEAVKAGDYETLAYHVREFYQRELGVPVPSANQSGSAAPDPRTSGGGIGSASAVRGTVYTIDEYNALFDQKEAARDRGDWNEVRRLSEEINRAPAEDRVRKN